MSKKLGQALREERENRGIRQIDIAFAADIHPTTVSHIEQGYPTQRITLSKIMDALSLSEARKEELRTIHAEEDG